MVSDHDLRMLVWYAFLDGAAHYESEYLDPGNVTYERLLEAAREYVRTIVDDLNLTIEGSVHQ